MAAPGASVHGVDGKHAGFWKNRYSRWASRAFFMYLFIKGLPVQPEGVTRARSAGSQCRTGGDGGYEP